jgi:hypothetical protein
VCRSLSFAFRFDVANGVLVKFKSSGVKASPCCRPLGTGNIWRLLATLLKLVSGLNSTSTAKVKATCRLISKDYTVFYSRS